MSSLNYIFCLQSVSKFKLPIDINQDLGQLVGWLVSGWLNCQLVATVDHHGWRSDYVRQSAGPRVAKNQKYFKWQVIFSFEEVVDEHISVPVSLEIASQKNSLTAI